MNTTELIIKPADQAIIDAITSTGKSWHEVQIPDHPIYQQFSRKLVVTGFNTPEMEGGEERVYVNFQQHLTLKEGNVLHKKINIPNWVITESNIEEVMGADGLLKGTRVTKNIEGDIISEVEEVLTVNSVQYVRFLVKNKHLHIVDVLERFMGLYIQLFNKEINDI